MAGHQKTFRSDPEPGRRNNWFLCDVLKAFVANDQVRELGPLPFALVTFFVTKEHGWGYRKLPHYSERQLVDAFGFGKNNRTSLRTALQALIDTGWLQRIDGHSERHGDWYRVVLPLWAEPSPEPNPAPTDSTGSIPGRNQTRSEPDPNHNQTRSEPQPNQPISHSLTQIPTPSPKAEMLPDEWAGVEGEMLSFGIQETTEPLRSLRDHGVSPELALGVLRHASQSKRWDAGKVRRRLLNLRPGQDPSLASLWPTPDRAAASASVADTITRAVSDRDSRQRDVEQRERQERWKQLEFEFGDRLETATEADVLRWIGTNPIKRRLFSESPGLWRKRPAPGEEIPHQRGIVLEAIAAAHST